MPRLSERVDWIDGRAVCAEPGVDPDDFFEVENAADDRRVPDPVRISRALAMCARCPILEECFYRAVYERAYGIRGGSLAEERGRPYRVRGPW